MATSTSGSLRAGISTISAPVAAAFDRFAGIDLLATVSDGHGDRDRDFLQSKGYSFYSRTDTEIIPAAYDFFRTGTLIPHSTVRS